MINKHIYIYSSRALYFISMTWIQPVHIVMRIYIYISNKYCEPLIHCFTLIGTSLQSILIVSTFLKTCVWIRKNIFPLVCLTEDLLPDLSTSYWMQHQLDFLPLIKCEINIKPRNRDNKQSTCINIFTKLWTVIWLPCYLSFRVESTYNKVYNVIKLPSCNQDYISLVRIY